MFFFAFLFFLFGILSYLYSLFFLLGSILVFLYLYLYQKKKKAYLFFLCTLIGYFILFFFPKGCENLSTLKGIVLYRKENYYLLFSLQGKFYIPSKSNNLTIFSIVEVNGSSTLMKSTHYESVFNFTDYLKTKGVFYEFDVTETNIIFKNPLNNQPLKNFAFPYLDENSKSFVSALLCGDSLSSNNAYDSLKDLNILSSFSLSGFHLSFFLSIISHHLKEEQRKYMIYFEIPLLLFFLFLSDFRYSIKRIFFAKILMQISKKGNLHLNYLDRTSILAIIFLIFEPYSIQSASFYYSFPLLFIFGLFQEKRKTDIKSKIIFSLSIMLFYLPFRMYQNPTFHVLSPFVQLLFIPITHFLFVISIFLFICPFLGYVLNFLIGFITKTLDLTSTVNFSLTTGLPSILFLICFYTLLFLILLFKTYGFKKQIKQTYILLFIVFSTSFIPDLKNHFEVTFIDVGQGDCTLIRYKRMNFLIDTGGNKYTDIATDCLIPYFNKRKISKLDAIFITHEDFDHYGALTNLKESFTVDNTYYATDFKKENNYTINYNSFNIINLNTYQSNNSDNNYNSGVYNFQIKEKSYLIMGDAPKEIELKIIANNPTLTCDVIKVGHHGSKTSSDKTFLASLKPSLAIISCGEKNSYGHPHKETLNTLDELNIQYKRTDLEGSIQQVISYIPF